MLARLVSDAIATCDLKRFGINLMSFCRNTDEFKVSRGWFWPQQKLNLLEGFNRSKPNIDRRAIIIGTSSLRAANAKPKKSFLMSQMRNRSLL
jgi:hypothetical protein